MEDLNLIRSRKIKRSIGSQFCSVLSC